MEQRKLSFADGKEPAVPAVISASRRTDIPALYGEWFIERLKAGYCMVQLPYGGGLKRVALDVDSVRAFVLWSKDFHSFFPAFYVLR